jgi:hypothetical protein
LTRWGGKRVHKLTDAWSSRQFIVPVLLLLVFAGGCAGCEREDITSVSNPSPPVVSARNFWSQALDMAQEWRSDAYVRLVRVDVPTPNGEVPEREDPRVGFVFQSPSEDHVTLVVTCGVKGCSSFEEARKLGYPVRQCIPIAFDDFTLDSADVLDISLQQGGQDYVSLPSASIFLKLSRSSPSCTESVVWRAAFIDVANRTGLDVIVDAVTGEIIEIRD